MDLGVLVICFISIFAVLCYLCYEGYKCYKIVTEDEKKKRITRGTWVGLEAFALFFLFGLTITNFSKFYATGFEEGGIDAMKARFNEPIVSEAELYGYEIIGTHIEKSTGSEKEAIEPSLDIQDILAIEYSLDIRDTLYKGQIFKKVKVSEALFKLVSIGQCLDRPWLIESFFNLKHQEQQPQNLKKDSP